MFQVSSILDKHPIWAEYKDQKHDLFLSDRPAAGYLQGKWSDVFSPRGRDRSDRDRIKHHETFHDRRVSLPLVVVRGRHRAINLKS